MDPMLEAAADTPGEEAARILGDFFAQITTYNGSILGSLNIPESMKERVAKLMETAQTATS